MKLFTAEQMREMDRIAIEELNIPSLTLMETAASHAVRAAKELAGGNLSAAVLAGAGNNGGDGFAAGRMLLEDGYTVRLFLVGCREKMTHDCRREAKAFCAAGGCIEDFTRPTEDILNYVNRCGVIIDAMFGIGLHSALREPASLAAQMANASPAPTLAVDIPSGVSADTGAVPGEAIRADRTVTFSFAKPGLFSEPGSEYAGKVEVCSIGIPSSVSDGFASNIETPDEADYLLPRRDPCGHKGTYGRVLIIAGCVGYTGAPALAAEAAVRCGAGLTFLGVPKEIYPVTAVKCSSSMPFPLISSEGHLTEDSFEEIARRLENADVCLVGPGLGRHEDTVALVQRIITACKVPLVLDADGIFALSKNIDILDKASCPIVLTPHPGEFGRLSPDASADRLTAAVEFAEKHGCTLVLKGHRTVTAFPDGSAVVNTTGNPGMAKGGSGDVLAGMIAAFLGQKLPLRKAIAGAVYYHGLAGDVCKREYGEYFMTPEDMTHLLYRVFKQ